MPKWKLQHSKSKPAWNIISTQLGGRYKIAQFPYLQDSNLSEQWNNKEIDEQKQNALKCIYAEDMFQILSNIFTKKTVTFGDLLEIKKIITEVTLAHEP